MTKVIKTAEEYTAALARLHSLFDSDPERGSETADQIELVALLLATYEKANFDSLPAPSPIEAIRFRMDQMNLAQKDLVKYLGSPSKVSEVLSGKRSLTLSMIRALRTGLSIPADLLVAESVAESNSVFERHQTVDITDLPVKEMIRRRWLPATSDDDVLSSAIQVFIDPILPYAAAFKRTVHLRGSRTADRFSLLAWMAGVWHKAKATVPQLAPYDARALTAETIRDVVRLSCLDAGPPMALEYIRRLGVAVVVEPPLPKTFVDGATLFLDDRPVIGLTLRFDRLDNFWYVLLHELSHVVLHSRTATVFLDDLESAAVDAAEREADDLALETAIPPEAWRTSPASKVRSRQAAEHLARQLRISPAIVAGRIRRRYNDYTVLSDMVGQNEVRRHFPLIHWNYDGDTHGS